MAERRVSRWATAGAGALACSALVLGGMGAGSATAATAAPALKKNVTIQNYLFMPKTLKIKVGTKVVWTNKDSTPHNVVFTGFSSKILATGATYKHTFTKAGTFAYHCSLHQEMTAKVVVTG